VFLLPPARAIANALTEHASVDFASSPIHVRTTVNVMANYVCQAIASPALVWTSVDVRQERSAFRMCVLSLHVWTAIVLLEKCVSAVCVLPLPNARATANATGRHALLVLASSILHARLTVNVMGNCACMDIAILLVAWTAVRVRHGRHVLSINAYMSHAVAITNATADYACRDNVSQGLAPATVSVRQGTYALITNVCLTHLFYAVPTLNATANYACRGIVSQGRARATVCVGQASYV
jgi:hypothetical protein